MPTKLVPAICTQCGGSVEVDPSQEKAFCKYCGTSFFVEKAINNYNVQHADIKRVESMNIHHHKRGAVESVLNFVEKQQDKKQKKIDEENRRLEEEKRKREEQRQKIMNQIFNKEYLKRNLIIVGAVAILILVRGIMGATSEKPSHEGEARTPGGSSYHQGRDYKDVVSDFEDNGFINIETEKLEDLITGWLTKDGEVESVSVDGDADYSAHGWYPNDVEVIITYHTFPE
jgi:DNA-directed RNA polymerase subunit RPC12/RpoP